VPIQDTDSGAAVPGLARRDDSAASNSLREHAQRSGRALGLKRLSVCLIDYEARTYAGPPTLTASLHTV
jgi:hypothetical protein